MVMDKYINYILKQIYQEVGISIKEGITQEEILKATYKIMSELENEQVAEHLIRNLLEASGDDKIDPNTKIKYKVKTKQGDQDRETTYEKAKKAKKDSPQYKAAVALEKGKSNSKEDSDKGFANDPGALTQAERDAESQSKESESEVEKSPKISGNVYGTVGEGDTDVKNDMFKYGFRGYQKGTGRRPAPGSPGSAFNEIASGEGVHMLSENPNMDEQELARKMYDQYKETALGKEQSASSGVGKIPTDIENQKLWSKCIISARSARTKYDTTQNRVNDLQSNGKFGSIDKIDTYYGAAESIEAQMKDINNANKVLLPDGTEVNKDDAIKFVKAGGGGMNPSDTATFVKDKGGNLLIQFHSDKTSVKDIQDNSTLSQEGENYKSYISKIDNISDDVRVKATKVVEEYSNRMSAIEDNYNNQTAKIAGRLSELPIETQVGIIQKDKGTLKKNIEEAIFGNSGKPKSQFRDYLPDDATSDSLSIEDKYNAIRRLVADGNGKSKEIKVITKVGLALQSKDPSIEGIDVKTLISDEREQVVNLQRERIQKLNSEGSVDVDGIAVPLGRLMEAEETIRGFHLSLMDYPPKGYKEGDPSSMVGTSLDVNMGGAQVNGDKLRGCIGVNNSTEFKQKFRLNEVDKIIKDDNGNVTGKTVFVYAIDSDGKQIEIGQKSYRSKAGATGKTNNTFTYSSQMQKCFKSK